MKDDEKKETSIKFQSKSEIAECIKSLTPFVDGTTTNLWALDKIK